MYKIYLLVFDPSKTDAFGLHNVIQNDNLIFNWWHYIGSAYLIKSQYTIESIQNEIIRMWPGNFFLLMDVDASKPAGWLPQGAWDWINQNK